jgi:hypothetical protein
MAMTVREIRAWLDSLAPEARVGVDEGGLILAVVGNVDDEYLEVGGIPEEDEQPRATTSS